MELKDIRKIGVIGAGTMGRGIAQVCAEAGFEVYLFDKDLETAQKAKDKIRESLKKRATTDKNRSVLGHKAAMNVVKSATILEKIHPDIFNYTHSKCALRELDFVIEAIYENLSVKQEALTYLDVNCKMDAIFATNTSSLKIGNIVQGLNIDRQRKIIGMHFMNPPTKNTLLEIIVSCYTEKETFDLVYNLAKKINREPIIASADVPGFLCNRNLIPSILESVRCLEDGIGSAEDIDKSIMLGVGGAMGPLSLGDLIGWDIVLAITKVLQKQFGARFDQPRILQHLVNQGYLGKKTKKGIFDFAKGE